MKIILAQYFEIFQISSSGKIYNKNIMASSGKIYNKNIMASSGKIYNKNIME